MNEPIKRYYDMIPSAVADSLAETFRFGEQERGYAEGTWGNYTPAYHIFRALIHIGHHLAGTNQEERNLDHALWRIGMAVTLLRGDRYNG